jgi:hypothetical protein
VLAEAFRHVFEFLRVAPNLVKEREIDAGSRGVVQLVDDVRDGIAELIP